MISSKRIGQKLFVLLLVCYILLTYSGCSDAFEYHVPDNYNLSNAYVSILYISSTGNQTVIKELGNGCPILDELAGIPCYTYFNDPCIDLEGYAIVIRYDPNNYEIITHSASQTIIDGKTYYGRVYFDTESFEALIEKYLGVAN